MYRPLWKAYYADDADTFRQLLENAPTNNPKGRVGSGKPSAVHHATGGGYHTGAVGSYGTAPHATKARAPSSARFGSSAVVDGAYGAPTRADVNSTRPDGCTILHLAASSRDGSGLEFVLALLEHPWTDLYVQDRESGWTALHRALYTGNLTIAYEILKKDAQRDHIRGQRSGELFKVKDHEKNTPFDLYAFTVQRGQQTWIDPMIQEDDEEGDDAPETLLLREFGVLDPEVDLRTSLLSNGISINDIFMFGSNKNITLGFGDSDDRQYPERIALKRSNSSFSSSGADNFFPKVESSEPAGILTVKLSKYHSAIVTADSSANLYLCGHGTGGRLGTGNEKSSLSFVRVNCGSSTTRIVEVALGENHTLAVSDNGDLYSWGLDSFGQLGHQLPSLTPSNQVDGSSQPRQLVPKRMSGLLKREKIITVAASRIHSIACTRTAMFAWGKNEGQFGVSLRDVPDPIVGPMEVFKSGDRGEIVSVVTTEKATCLLLSTGSILLFTHHKILRVDLGPEGGIIDSKAPRRRHLRSHGSRSYVERKIAAGDEIISILTEHGEVYNLTIRGTPAFDHSESDVDSGKTFYKAQRIWSAGRFHMEAKDIDTDRDGGIILVTQAGSVWRRIRRRAVKYAGSLNPKQFKFVKVPGLNRVKRVCASGHGAYAAINETDMSTKMVGGRPVSLDPSLFELSPLRPLFDWNPEDASTASVPTLKAGKLDELQQSTQDLFEPRRRSPISGRNIIIKSSMSEIEFPVHFFMIAARYRQLARAISDPTFHGQSYGTGIRVESGPNETAHVIFDQLGFTALFAFVDNLYKTAPKYFGPVRAPRPSWLDNDAVRAELRKKVYEPLDRAERSDSAARSFGSKMKEAMQDHEFFDDGDVIIELADDEVRVHGAMMQARSPFFQTILSDQWRKQLDSQHTTSKFGTTTARVDLTQFEFGVFQPVLDYIYTGHKSFLDIEMPDIDSLVDFLLNVIHVADFLLLDGLSEICQAVVGLYVNDRNVCSVLNDTADLKMKTLKEPALRHICHNLESLIENNYLYDLDEDLFDALDEAAQDAFRNNRAEARFLSEASFEEQLLEVHPELADGPTIERQELLEDVTTAMRLAEKRARLAVSKATAPEHASPSMSPNLLPKTRRRSDRNSKPDTVRPAFKPALKPRSSTQDLMFNMDDEESDEDVSGSATPSKTPKSPMLQADRPISSSFQDTASPSQTFDGDNMSTSFALGSPDPGAAVEMQSPGELELLPETESPAVGPWSGQIQSKKLGMKEIMEQAAASRTSGISLGMSAAAQPPSSSGPLAAPKESAPKEAKKMSQKERKKMLQQQLQQSVPTTPPKAEKSSSWQTPPSKPTNPWQATSSTPKTAMKDILSETSPQTSRVETAGPAASPSTRSKSLPLASTPQRAPSHGQSPSPALQPTSTNSPAAAPPKPPLGKSPELQKLKGPQPQPPAIRSIRHTPLPSQLADSAAANASLNSIFSEQQAQKDYKYTLAKNSLADIQQEQEFNEWFEREVAANMAAEAATAEEKNARKSTGSSRGGRGGRGRGGGGSSTRGAQGGAKGRGGAAASRAGGGTRGGREGEKRKTTKEKNEAKT